MAVPESEFQRKQKDAQIQYYTQTVNELQMKIAVLISQKEDLEKKLKEHLDEESKHKLEKRVKELMSEVQQERRDRSEADSRTKKLAQEVQQERRGKDEADARNRQLASELFQLRSLTKSGSQVATPEGSLQLQGHDESCRETRRPDLNQESQQKQFACKFCSLSGRTFLNSSSDLEHVFATLLNDQKPDSSSSKSMASLKTTTCEKLESIATELAKHADVGLNCERGQLWKKDKDFKFVSDKPIDSQLRRREDGLATEVVFRINCQSKMATMKVGHCGKFSFCFIVQDKNLKGKSSVYNLKSNIIDQFIYLM